MPPVSSRETIPNFPLNGHELAIYAVRVFEQVCKQRDVLPVVSGPATEALLNAMKNHFGFKSSYAYPGVFFEIAFQSHVIRNHETRVSFTVTPNFSGCEPFVRRPLHCSAPPLEGWSPEAEHVVDCFTIRVKVENPNLVRVHQGMPIVISEKVPPKHGMMLGSIEHHEVKYDPKDYGDPPPFLVLDQRQEFIAKWNLPLAIGIGLMAGGYVPADEQELVLYSDEPDALAATMERAVTEPSTPESEGVHFVETKPRKDRRAK